MRTVLRISLVLLVLSCPVYAGEVGYGVTGPPPPPPPSATTGDIQHPSAFLIEAALALLSIVLP